MSDAAGPNGAGAAQPPTQRGDEPARTGAPIDAPTMNASGANVSQFNRADTVNFYTSSVPPPPRWRDPSRPARLPEPLSVDGLHLTEALEGLRTLRVLVVECVDGQVQRGVTSALVKRLAPTGPVVEGWATLAHDVEREDRDRWRYADLVHAELGGGASVLMLEAEGATGAGIVDSMFASQATAHKLAVELASLDRYVVLLPRGQATSALVARHATRDFPMARLAVPYLGPLLRRRFPRDADRLATLLERDVAKRQWSSEEEVHAWLSRLPDGADGVRALEHGLVEGVGETRASEATRDALDRCLDADAPLLTAMFVATHFPPLSPFDFCGTVEALLGEAEAPLAPEVLSAAAHWRRDLRRILTTADLEQRPGTGETTTIGFRQHHAARQVASRLAHAPMFIRTQLERVRTAGLLFARSRPVADAAVELLAARIPDDADGLDVAWATSLLRHARASGQDWGARRAAAACGLLRSLTAQSVVDDILDRLLQTGDGVLALEVAYRLRDTPGGDVWHWLRQGVERGNVAVRDRASDLIARLVADPSARSDALTELLTWLTLSGHTASAADRVLGTLVAASIRPARSGEIEAPLLLHLDEVVAAAGDGSVAPVVSVLFREDVVDSARERIPKPIGVLDVYVLTALLPPHLFEPGASGELERGLDVVVELWPASWSAACERAQVDLGGVLFAATTLATWSEARADQPAQLAALASALRAELPEHGRRVRACLRAFEEIVRGYEASIDRWPIGGPARTRWHQAAKRKRRTWRLFQNPPAATASTVSEMSP